MDPSPKSVSLSDLETQTLPCSPAGFQSIQPAGGGTLSGFTPASTALFAYLALLSSIAFALWTCLLKYNNVGMVSVFNFLIPVFGVLWGALFLHEPIGWDKLTGGALVLAGISLTTGLVKFPPGKPS